MRIIVSSERIIIQQKYVSSSAKANNESLSFNDRLELGDNFIPPLFDNIFRFRLHLIAITADIEKTFLQVGIKNDDRDYLRFLWFDVNKSKPAVIQFRFARLPFGLKPSPSILGTTIHKHMKSFAEREPKVVYSLSNYMLIICHAVQKQLRKQ